jgi:hypothetical protein
LSWHNSAADAFNNLLVCGDTRFAAAAFAGDNIGGDINIVPRKLDQVLFLLHVIDALSNLGGFNCVTHFRCN